MSTCLYITIFNVQYPSDARYKAFHTRTRSHEKRNACCRCEMCPCNQQNSFLLMWRSFSRMSKRVCSACETRFKHVILVCEMHSPYRKLVKCVLWRIHCVCFALIDPQMWSPAVSVSIYHLDNLPIYPVLCFLKSHSWSTHESFSRRKNVLQNFGRWLESVLDMYMYIITITTLAPLKACPHLIRIRSISISHLNPLS